MIGAIYNGMYLLGLAVKWEFIVTGGVLIGAVTIDALSRRGTQRHRRHRRPLTPGLGQGPAGPVSALRVALIGYGLSGRVFHAPLLAATPGLELTTIVTADPDRQGRARLDVPDARVVRSPDDVWARADGARSRRGGEHDRDPRRCWPPRRWTRAWPSWSRSRWRLGPPRPAPWWRAPTGPGSC